MGFFLKDLHQQIEQMYEENEISCSFRVYRGQGMSGNDFDKLKRNVGALLSFSSFLSTTKDEKVSLTFAEAAHDIPDAVAILFIIDIDPKIKSYPFAFISKDSYFKAENEVLFSMNTIFRIRSVKNSNDIWYVYLQLTGEEDFQLRQLSEYIRNNLGGWTKLERLAEMLWRLGEYARSREVYELVLDRTDQTKTERVASLYGQLGMVCVDMSDLEAALAHQQKALKLKLTYLSADDPAIAVIYTNTGLVYWKRGDFNEALEQYQQAIDIELKRHSPDVPNIGSRYNNIGLVLRDQGRYSEALETLHRARELLTGSLPSTHPWVSQLCGYISGVYCLQKDYSKADEYSFKCLTMSLKSLPPKHINLALAHNARAEALEGLGLYKDALEHAQKAIGIAQYNSVLSTDPDRQKYEQTLERLRRKT